MKSFKLSVVSNLDLENYINFESLINMVMSFINDFLSINMSETKVKFFFYKYSV